MNIALEFSPYAQVSHLTFAWQVVVDADRQNGGVLLDSWHYFRSGSQHEQLSRIPVDRIFSVQLGDVLPEALGDLKTEGRHHRQFPGAGAGDLTGLLATLAAMNYHSSISVEVFSDALAALPARRAAHDCMSAARATLRSATLALPAASAES